MIDRFNNKENGKLALNIAMILLYEIIYLAILMTSYQDYFFYYSNGYFIFFLMYLTLYIVFGRLFSAMNIGETTTTDLFLSHSLTLLFTNAFIFLVLCLITLRILPLWPILSMQAIEMAFAALFLYLGNHFIKNQYRFAVIGTVYHFVREKLFYGNRILKEHVITYVGYSVSSLSQNVSYKYLCVENSPRW